MASTQSTAHDRTLLHACCGPCSLEPTRILKDEGVDFAIHYANSNIFPPEEHAQRLDTLKEHVTDAEGIDLLESAYDTAAWEREVAPHGTDREARCRACYRLRFEETAQTAKEQGFGAISTTLTISPYQFTDIILEELEAAAARHGLEADARDYRDRYREATRRSREMGMYRQNYCGCRFSIAEAEAERKAAKELREREKRQRHIAAMRIAAEGIGTQENQL